MNVILKSTQTENGNFIYNCGTAKKLKCDMRLDGSPEFSVCFDHHCQHT